MAEKLAGLNKSNGKVTVTRIETIKSNLSYTTSWNTSTITFSHNLTAASLRFDWSDNGIIGAYVPQAWITRIVNNVVYVGYKSNVAASLTVVIDGFYTDTININ